MNSHYINFYKLGFSLWEMGYGKDFEKILNEMDNFNKVVEECIGISKTKSNYAGMNMEELSTFYDRIEGGLISNNFILQNNSDLLKKITESDKKNVSPEEFLESHLLSVVLNMIIKDPYNSVPSKYKESLWISKIKDREYYNRISEIAGIPLQDRDSLYSFLNE